MSLAPAHAAKDVHGPERAKMIRAAANSPAGKRVQLRLKRGKVSMAPTMIPGPATAVAFRSEVDPKWAILVATSTSNTSQRRAFVLKRTAGHWRVKFAAGRGEEERALCRSKQPGAAVAFDLGLPDPVSGRCRYRRDPLSLSWEMTPAEVPSVRAMVEWTQDPDSFEYLPGPVQPARSDITSVGSCSWDGAGSLGLVPSGRVSRADPRFGVVYVGCVFGSDGFSLLETSALVVVKRSGSSGVFTSVPGLVLPRTSPASNLCLQDLAWPIPAVVRAGLGVCTPYPLALRNALR